MICRACGNEAPPHTAIRMGGPVRICSNVACRAILGRVEEEYGGVAIRPVDDAGVSAPATGPRALPAQDDGDDLDFSTIGRTIGGPAAVPPHAAVRPKPGQAPNVTGPVDVLGLARVRLAWLRAQIKIARGHEREARELEAVLGAARGARRADRNRGKVTPIRRGA